MLLELFITFFKIGLFTFGGGYAMIPLISEEVIKFSITSKELTNFIAISESTPGPFAINIATFIGYTSYGILGAIVSTIAIVLPSLIIITIIAIFINKIKDSKFFKSFIKILTPVVLALILSSTLNIFNLSLFNLESIYNFNNFKLNINTLISLFILLIFIVIFYLIKKKKPNTYLIILLSLIIGISSSLIIIY